MEATVLHTSIFTDVIANPSSEESKIRRKALPM